MGQHVFVAMPYGERDGINFDAIYQTLIKPALTEAGFDVFRADEENQSGDIRVDMFQELLLADLVIADITQENPNVWYELGIRHGLRARGYVQMRGKIEGVKTRVPFDVSVDRTFSYRLKNGAPDPDTLEKDKKALAEFVIATMEAIEVELDKKESPVFNLLRYLQEPDWKSLLMDEFAETWKNWEQRLELARRERRPGDVRAIAEAAPIRALRFEGLCKAGNALIKEGQFAFALSCFEEALKIDPHNLECRRQKGLVLGKLKRKAEAEVWLEAVAKDHPEDAETWGLLGRLEKEDWIETWCDIVPEKMRAEAAFSAELLKKAINTYLKGFRIDPRKYYPGINALTLAYLHQHLTGELWDATQLNAIEGGVRWAVQGCLENNKKDYWAKATLADIEILTGKPGLELLGGTPASVKNAYNAAIVLARDDWFALNSIREQLLLLKRLEFELEKVEIGIALLNKAIERIEVPREKWRPRKVFLFSGHMIDKPGRPEPRFPPDKEPIAKKAIEAKLDDLQAAPDDLALCGGACGGDLLFAEACLARGLKLELRIPFDEETFLKNSVTFAGDDWRDRFYAVKDNEKTKLLKMPEQLGKFGDSVEPYELDNLWQLYTALAWGPERVQFICLWNGKGGDGKGGTEHMYKTVRNHRGKVHHLNTTKLW
ncbi:MAG: DUF4071 domain-containing protein [Acidobacteria bacterium]|nr:DUF4071 domain-containing protein [Acidobacteriota bacterium]